MISHVIRVWSATGSVRDEPCDQCRINYVISAGSVTWSVHESLQCSPRTWSAFENKQNYFTEIIVNYLLLSFCFYFCCRNMDLCLLFLGSLFISVYGKISGVKNLLRHNICINSSWWAFWVLGEPTDKFFFHSPEKCIGLLLLWKDFFFPFSFLSHISALVLPVFSNGEWLKLMLF